MSPKRFANHELVRRYRDWLVCQRYSRTTREVYNRVVGKFLQSWGRRKFSQVRPLDIQEFMTESSRRDISREVVHRYLWALRSFFDFLCLRGVVDEVAPRLVRSRPAPRRLLRALSEANVRRLINAAANPRDRAILELFYATGCRLSELVNIRFEHVDFARRTILVRGKSGDRRVFFGLTAKERLTEHLRGRKTGFLFESQYLVQKGCVSWNGAYWCGYWLVRILAGLQRRIGYSQTAMYSPRTCLVGFCKGMGEVQKVSSKPGSRTRSKKAAPADSNLYCSNLQGSCA